MIDFASKTRNFALKTRNCVSKTRIFCTKDDEFCSERHSLHLNLGAFLYKNEDSSKQEMKILE